MEIFDGKLQRMTASAGMESAGKWVAFISEMARAQGQHVPVRMKDKAGKCRKLWVSKRC